MRLALVLALLMPALAWGQPYAVGDTLPSLRLEDQHGRTHTLHERVRVVVFTRDMDAGDVVRAALGDGGATRLANAGAVYIADVSGMPALIRRMFALPKMRQRGYPMLLDTDGETTARFPARAGQPTLLILDGLRIEAVQHHPDQVGVRAALEALAAMPPGPADAPPAPTAPSSWLPPGAGPPVASGADTTKDRPPARLESRPRSGSPS